jgi:hypothetical protein
MKIKRAFVLPSVFTLLFSGLGPGHATKVLPSTQDVENPSYALGAPDGKYAGVEYLANLDMEFHAKNMEGDDIIVHARSPFDPRFGTTTYRVFGRSKNGEWEYIGTGCGKGEAEDFDLGNLPEMDSIRILYQNPYEFLRLPRQWKNQMGIDSVEVIH